MKHNDSCDCCSECDGLGYIVTDGFVYGELREICQKCAGTGECEVEEEEGSSNG